MTYEIAVLSVVHLAEQLDVPMDIEPIMNAFRAQYENQLTNLQEMAKSQGITITAEIVMGNPADNIIEFAKKNQINMIIISNIQYIWLKRFNNN